ncbi:hypothetical protein BpHYR1_015805 [Brachionus plicatilis]|uniref:Uncharacterized protein n=1 Tax=Brachionus plicatilis TaxID=10195 RepID=A0A3M7RHQ4_BRAPC|nr:hypothetical protein BpHYR1_015805 [Brachionus plicatilis]
MLAILNLIITVQIKTNLYAFCSSTLLQLFQWGKEKSKKSREKENCENLQENMKFFFGFLQKIQRQVFISRLLFL